MVGDTYDGGKFSGDTTYLYPGFTLGIVGQYQGGHLRAGREAVLVKIHIEIVFHLFAYLDPRLGLSMATMVFQYRSSPQFVVPGAVTSIKERTSHFPTHLSCFQAS